MRHPSFALAALVAGAALLPTAVAGADRSPPGTSATAWPASWTRPGQGRHPDDEGPLTIRDRQGRVLVGVFAAEGFPWPGGGAARTRASGHRDVGRQTGDRGFWRSKTSRVWPRRRRGQRLAGAAGRARTSGGDVPGVRRQRVDVLPRGIDGRASPSAPCRTPSTPPLDGRRGR